MTVQLVAPATRSTQIQTQIQIKSLDDFFDDHFKKIAFAVSSFVLFVLSPLHFILGTAAGFAIHRFSQPDLSVKYKEPILTSAHVVFTMVGAAAALLQMTPAGMLGGTVFRSIPLLSSMAVGSTGHRFFRAIACSSMPDYSDPSGKPTGI